MKRIIQNTGMKQFVTQPTRITKTTRTLIDYVISNLNNLNVNVLLDEKISDHSSIVFKVKNKVLKNNITLTKLCGYTKESFIHNLTNVEWSLATGMSVNKKADFLTKNIKLCLSDFIQNVTIKEKNKEWYNGDLNNQRILRDETYKKAQYTNNLLDWLEYDQVSKSYSLNIKCAKNTYYHDKLFNAGNDQKKVWKILKSIINGVNESIENVDFNGELKNNKQEIADSFNKFFIESIKELNDSIPSESDNFQNNIEIKSECKFDIVTVEKIEAYLKNIKSKSDPEFITKQVLLDALPVIGSLFTDVINSSMEYAICPRNWKNSTVSPIPKLPGTKKCEEFRPINTLPTYEKVLEEAIKESIESHIETNDIIIKEQSGFRKRHSCESALNLAMMNWMEDLESGKIIIAVFLDLKRAFETIDRQRLLAKLEKIGIKERELNWLRCYLSNRTQCTKFGGATSAKEEINIGLPQGSKLAAVLFSLYMNDIKSCLVHLMILLFADDTLLYYSGDNINDIVNKVNEDLERINKWLNVNKLKLNLPKTKYMVICKSDKDEYNVDIRINNKKVDRTYTMKYLGVMIDSNLKMKSHNEYIGKKIAKKIGFFARISKHLSIEHRIKVYKAIIAPHFEYCPSILSMSNEGEFKELQKLQNRSMRIILRCKKETSVALMLDTLKWMNVKQRIMYRTLIVVFQIKHNLLPSYLSEKLKYVGDTHHHDVRNAMDFRLQTDARKSLFFMGLKMFNKLPQAIKTESQIKVFKRLLSEHMKECYKIN